MRLATIIYVLIFTKFSFALDTSTDAPAPRSNEIAIAAACFNNPAVIEDAFLGENPTMLAAIYQHAGERLLGYKGYLLVKIFSHLALHAFSKGDLFNQHYMRTLLSFYYPYLLEAYDADELCIRLKKVFNDNHYSMSHLIFRNIKATTASPAHFPQRHPQVNFIKREEQHICLIEFAEFSEQNLAEIAKTLAYTLENDINIALNLAHNRGGSVEVLKQLLGFFLPPGTVCGLKATKELVGATFHNAAYFYNNEMLYKKTRTNKALQRDFLKTLSEENYHPEYQAKIAIIISENTFSAAEHFARILQLNGRATIMGTPSTGYALFCRQKLFSNSSQKGIKLTFPIAELLCEGESIEKIGVRPDLNMDELGFEECIRQWLKI